MSLSDKIERVYDKTYTKTALAVIAKDIKESIKNIKQELCQRVSFKGEPCNLCINCKIINEEAGDKFA